MFLDTFAGKGLVSKKGLTGSFADAGASAKVIYELLLFVVIDFICSSLF